eukprot:RCo014077
MKTASDLKPETLQSRKGPFSPLPSPKGNRDAPGAGDVERATGSEAVKADADAGICSDPPTATGEKSLGDNGEAKVGSPSRSGLTILVTLRMGQQKGLTKQRTPKPHKQVLHLLKLILRASSRKRMSRRNFQKGG